MATATGADVLRLVGSAAGGPGGLSDGVGERLEVVDGAGERHREVRLMAHDLPAARSGGALGVGLAQVVAVRLGVGGERADDGRAVGIDVGERRDGRGGARGARAAPDRAHEERR